MTTDTLLLILTGLCAFLAAAVVWLVLEMRLLKIQTSENLRRDEQDEMIEAILTGVRSERQEVQQAVLNVERGRGAYAQRDGQTVACRDARGDEPPAP